MVDDAATRHLPLCIRKALLVLKKHGLILEKNFGMGSVSFCGL